MNIALVMMGGDFAPLEKVKGVQLFLSQPNPDAHLTLIGDEARISPLLEEFKIDPKKITVVHASHVIEMQEHPTKALKEKQQSSISIGFHLLATSRVDAFISAGNTGAMLVGSLYRIKAIEGIARAAIRASCTIPCASSFRRHIPQPSAPASCLTAPHPRGVSARAFRCPKVARPRRSR